MANKKKSSNRTGNELVTVFHAVQQFQMQNTFSDDSTVIRGQDTSTSTVTKCIFPLHSSLTSLYLSSAGRNQTEAHNADACHQWESDGSQITDQQWRLFHISATVSLLPVATTTITITTTTTTTITKISINQLQSTYIHTYIHTHIHTHIHTYTHTYIHTYIHRYELLEF